MLEGNPDVDEIVLFPRRELAGLFQLPRQIAWMMQLRTNCASDLVIDFQGLLRSAFIGRACRGRGGLFVGLSDAREGSRFFYDRVVPVAREHAVDRYLKAAAALGLDISGPPVWRLPEGIRPAGFSVEGAFCLLHPFSRGEGKSLPVADVRAFCEGVPFPVVIAGRGNAALAGLPANASNWLNRTSLPELIRLIRQARFVVSVDSGPMHIAAAITPELLSIHTWSDPELVGPYREEAWVWKDRALFQMKDLRDSAKKRLAGPDIASVAGWVRDRMERSANL